MNIVKLAQNSPEWLEWRKKGLGASDATIIKGLSKYKTRRQLWENKLGLAPSDPESYITELGHEFEPIARARFALETGVDLIPDVCGEHSEFPWLRASFDGLCDQERVFAEIKMMGKKNLEQVRQTKKPLDEHFPQVQQQHLVSRYERGFYIAYTLTEDKKAIEDYEAIPIFSDKTYIDSLFQELKSFWELVETQTPPELEKRDEYEFKDKAVLAKAKSFLAKKIALQKAQEDYDMVEAELKGIAAKHPLVRIGDVFISTIVRKGNVDYKKVPQLKGVDLEPFRGKPSSYKKIDVRKKE